MLCMLTFKKCLDITDKAVQCKYREKKVFLLNKLLFEFLGAIFALQHCIELHKDIADYWLNLARSYSRLSNCFEFKDQNECHLSENMCTIQTHPSNDAGESADADDTIKTLNEMTFNNKTAKAALPKKEDMMLQQPSCEKNDSLNQETVNTTKSYAENHPYCFRTLCSAIIGR